MNKQIPFAIERSIWSACPPVLERNKIETTEDLREEINRIELSVSKTQQLSKEVTPRVEEEIARHELKYKTPQWAGYEYRQEQLYTRWRPVYGITSIIT